MANEPGSIESSASTGMDAGDAFNSTADHSTADHSITDHLTADHPTADGLAADNELEGTPGRASDQPSDTGTHFFSSHAALSRSLSALEAIDRAEDESAREQQSARPFSAQPYATSSYSRQPYVAPGSTAQPFIEPRPAERQHRGLFWRKVRQSEPRTASPGALKHPVVGGYSVRPIEPVVEPLVTGEQATGDVGFEGAFAPRPKAWWEKQPYSAIAHCLALSGTLTGAWLFGILVAQILPGDFANPPLQEAMLRRTSRLSQRLWHFPQLWQTPTAETRIEAIPLPETGPLLAPIKLPPIERQPLVDELNSIETEMLTLDRRLQTIEKRLGNLPYQGASVENRVNSLRVAIDPPVKPEAAAESDYKPTPINPTDQLLEVARLKITLPSDALFSPGASELKDTALLNQVLDQLVNYPKATVVIRSYSDNQAVANVSRDYTQQQAIALSDYLSKHLNDLGTYRWVTVGAGQSQPVGSNDDDTGRQRNRRIEILVDTRSNR